MKKVISLVLGMIMAVSLLAACGSSQGGGNTTTAAGGGETTAGGGETTAGGGETTAAGGGETQEAPNASISWEDSYVRVAIEADPGTFGPFETNNNGRRQTLPEIYECLGMYQGHGDTVVGVMAKDWHPVDGKENTYSIELYDYITDSNGNEITADDVIFSFTEGAQIFKRYLNAIDTIEKVDDYTLELKLKADEVGALDHILALCYIVDEDSYKGDSDSFAYEPVGTGPYKLIDYVEGSKIIIEARDDYWQKDESLLVNNQFQNVKTIEFQVVKESAQKSNLLKTGEIDVVAGMSYEQAKTFMDDPNYNVMATLDQKSRTLVFNCNESSVCSSLELRQAILYAIDSAGVLAGFDDAGELAWAWGNSTYPDVYESWRADGYYDYDLDKATELMKKSGVAAGTTIRILTDTSEMNATIANVIMGYLSQINLNVEIMQFEQTLAKTYMRDFESFDIYLVYNGTADYAVSMYQERLTNKSYDNGLNYCGINDPKLQELLDTAVLVKNHDEAHMTELHEYIKENALIYAMFSPYVYTVSNANMTQDWLTEGMWLVPGCCQYVWN